MLKKNKFNIFLLYWFFVIVMTGVYFLLSNVMLTNQEFRTRINLELAALGWTLPAEFNWGIVILAALIVYWVLLFVYRDN